MAIADTYRGSADTGYIPVDGQEQIGIPTDGVASIEVVPDRYHDLLWSLYQETFTEIQEETPTLQIMHEDDFKRALIDPEITKMFSFSDGQPATMLIYSSIKKSPEYFPWNSLPYFEKNFPDDYESDRMYYFVGLFTNPAFQGSGDFMSLVKPLFDDIRTRHPEGAHFIYDCCNANEWLAEVLYSLAERYHASLPENERWSVGALGRLGTQTYYSIPMTQE